MVMVYCAAGAGCHGPEKQRMHGLLRCRQQVNHTVRQRPSAFPEEAFDSAKSGHYEGLDARIMNHVDEAVSIGDYVLTGGELASMVIIDSVTRLLKGAIADDSTREESHENGLLEYPQYTQPADYNGEKVPAILLSGNHEKIRQWRLVQSLLETKKRRPDLYARHVRAKMKKKALRAYEEGKLC